MKLIQRASVKELALKMKANGSPPRFAFFLGAGASLQSGIIAAGEMIQGFKESILTACCPIEIKTDIEKEKWLQTQAWYRKNTNEYSTLFEKFEAKEIGRQRYIERMIEGKEPSFGYLVLANLMASNLINTIVTTNFDDLIFKACTGHVGIRPVVYAYGIGASELRVSGKRHKILKLHGDYLYSSLKNTDHEIAAQDPNMVRQLSQVLNEYGLVVVGYSGGDESVMNILSGISEKNDLYWCVKSGTEPKNSVKKLLQQKHGVLIEIDGFDEMMNEIGEIVGFDLPSIVEAMHDRQNALIERLRSFTTNPRNSPKILRQLVEALKAQSERQEEQIRKTEALDWFMRAYEAQNEGKHSDAKKLYSKAIELHPTDAMAHNNLGWSYHNESARWADAEKEYKRAIELDPNLDLAYQNLSNLYQSQGRSVEAIPFLQRFTELHPESTRGHVGLGYAYLLMRKMNKAGEEFEKAQRLDAKDYNVFLNIGILRLMEGHKRDAIAMWRKGLELCHDESMFGKTNRVLYTFAIGRTNDGLRSMADLIQATKPGPATLNMALEDAKQLARAPTPPRQIKRMIALLQNALAAAKRRASRGKERLT